MAGNLLISISADERERAVFRSRRMYQTDLESNLATAEERGRLAGKEEGRTEGRDERNIEIARYLLSTGDPIDKVISATGLTREAVEKIIKTTK